MIKKMYANSDQTCDVSEYDYDDDDDDAQQLQAAVLISNSWGNRVDGVLQKSIASLK